MGTTARNEPSTQGKKVQAILARWHEHIRYFYEPTLEILRGLGEGVRGGQGGQDRQARGKPSKHGALILITAAPDIDASTDRSAT